MMMMMMIMMMMRAGTHPCTTSGSALIRCPVARIHTELARRAYSVAAPFTWYSLPADIRLCESILAFKRNLRTQLFKFSPPVLPQSPLYLWT